VVEFLPALPIGTDREYPVLPELFHGALYLTLGKAGGLSKVLFAGGAPPSMLLAVFTNQRADSVHYVFV
jgi:hypothetical protein